MAVNSLSQNFVNDPHDNTKQNINISFIKKIKQAY